MTKRKLNKNKDNSRLPLLYKLLYIISVMGFIIGCGIIIEDISSARYTGMSAFNVSIGIIGIVFIILSSMLFIFCRKQ